jgi:hypothetical protein
MRVAVLQATDALNKLKRAVNEAGSGAGKFRENAGSAGREARQLATSAELANRQVTATAKSSAGAGGPFKALTGGLKTATGGVKGLNAAMKANIMGAIIGLLMMFIPPLIDMAMHSKTVQKIVQVAFKVIGQAVDAVMKGVKAVIAWVMPLVAGYFKTYLAVVMAVWNGVKSGISAVVNWISGIPAKFRQVGEGISRAWGGLAGIARSAFQAVLGAVRGPINAVIGLVNGMISRLNSIHVSIPGWVPGVGGQSFGVNLPHIPSLAEGGIALPVPGGRLVTVAEAGQAEAIVPLSKLSSLLAAQARLTPAAAAATVNVYPRAAQSEYEIGRVVAREISWAAKR